MKLVSSVLILVVLLVVAAATISACGSPPAQPSVTVTVPGAATSPGQASSSATTAGTSVNKAEAQALLTSRCTSCHGLDRITSAHKTKDQWKATVDQMIRNGAKLSPDEETVLVNYLAATYP